MTAPQGAPGFPEGLESLADEYEYVREIGSGGMAAVYLARERSANRLVAIKAIRRRYLEDEETVLRFAREARMLAELHHSNIVETFAVHHVGEKALAIVMQHLSGGTLRQALQREGSLSYQRATTVLRDVAEALRHAHAQGVVHRDVKPENIFLEEGTGRAVLSDFGIARPMIATEDENELTLVGAAIGTPTYMSPEQIDGIPLDGRSDVYSLGLVGWEMLTGRRPWEGENLYGIIYKQKHEELPRVTEFRPDVPTPLLFAIEGALHKHRDTRWADLEEFLDQLCERVPDAAPRPVMRLLKDADVVAPEAEVAEPDTSVREEGEPAVEESEVSQREVARPVFSQWGFLRSKEPSPTGVAGEVAAPRMAGVVRRLRRLPARTVAAGALSLVLVLATVLALDGSRRSNGEAAPLDSDSAATTVTAGALEPDSATASAPAALDTTGLTPERPAVPPTRAAPSPGARPGGRVVARSHLDSLLLCDSPVQTHQRACLFAHISDNDTELNRVYRDLIADLRLRAGAATGRGEPESVRTLRSEQREWLGWRDEECRRRGREQEGQLWAPLRARCFAEFSDARAKELNGQLSRLRGSP